MKTNDLRRFRFTPVAAPSLRVPAHRNNRGLLRWLRAMESAAWDEAAFPRPEPVRIPVGRFSHPPIFQVNIQQLTDDTAH